MDMIDMEAVITLIGYRDRDKYINQPEYQQ